MGQDFSPQELKRLNQTQLVEHGQQALEAEAYEQAAALLREAVRRAPMRQDLKDLLAIAIEGMMQSGRTPRRPEPPPRPQPRPAAPERPSPPPARREEPPRAAPYRPYEPEYPPEQSEPWPYRQAPRAPGTGREGRPEHPEPREERIQPGWQPRSAAPDSEAEDWPPPRQPRPRFTPPPESWPEEAPRPRAEARPVQPRPEYRSEPHPQARPEPQPRDAWYANELSPETVRPRQTREGVRNEPAQGSRYPRPQQAAAPYPQYPAPRPANTRPINFQRRHKRGPILPYIFGALFGLIVMSAVGGIGWLYFQHPELLDKLQDLRKPSIAELDSANARARLHAQKGEYAKAYAVLAEFPESPERNARLAAMHGDEGDQLLFINTPHNHDGAIKAYQEAIRLDSGNPQYHNRLAEAYYQLALSQSADHKAADASLDKARQTCEAVLAQHAENVDTLEILSHVAVQKRDDALLATTLQRIIDVAPESEKAAKARQTQRELGLVASPVKPK